MGEVPPTWIHLRRCKYGRWSSVALLRCGEPRLHNGVLINSFLVTHTCRALFPRLDRRRLVVRHVRSLVDLVLHQAVLSFQHKFVLATLLEAFFV